MIGWTYMGQSSTPSARTSDPETSWQAAASINNLTARQLYVLKVLSWYPDGLTDAEIASRYPTSYEKQSPSGLRTRRAELAELRLVEDTGLRRAVLGHRASIVWRRT